MVIKHGQCTGSSCEPWGSLQRGSHSGGTRIGVVSQNVHISCKGEPRAKLREVEREHLSSRGSFEKPRMGPWSFDFFLQGNTTRSGTTAVHS
jgi:hypothetical protein